MSEGKFSLPNVVSGGVLWPRLVLWLLLVVSKWPFVLSYYLIGYSTAELPLSRHSLQASCVGNTFFSLSIGMELKINRGSWKVTMWCDVMVDVGRRHVNSGTVASCLPSRSWYWLSNRLAGSSLGSESERFPVFWWWKEGFSGLFVPTELQSGLISHLSGNNLPSDRLIAVWVVTKKESILLAVCLAKWNRFLKLYQNVIIPGFKNMPSGCGEDLQIPQVKSPVRGPLAAPGSVRGGEVTEGQLGPEGTSPNLILESELSFFFLIYQEKKV